MKCVIDKWIIYVDIIDLTHLALKKWVGYEMDIWFHKITYVYIMCIFVNEINFPISKHDGWSQLVIFNKYSQLTC
jgi:hypothetical protein